LSPPAAADSPGGRRLVSRALGVAGGCGAPLAGALAVRVFNAVSPPGVVVCWWVCGVAGFLGVGGLLGVLWGLVGVPLGGWVVLFSGACCAGLWSHSVCPWGCLVWGARGLGRLVAGSCGLGAFTGRRGFK
jgi:hypothetical protein